MGFGDKLSQLMDERGITNYKLHKDLGFSNSSIANWKDGKFQPNSNTIKKIAEYFNVSVDELLDIGITESTDTSINSMFFVRLEELCKKNNTTPATVTLKLGYINGSISRWKKGNCPSGEIISRFADYFSVTTDYLLGRTDNPNPIPQPQLSQQDRAMLDEIKSLSPERQKALEMALKILKSEEEEKSALKNA